MEAGIHANRFNGFLGAASWEGLIAVDERGAEKPLKRLTPPQHSITPR